MNMVRHNVFGLGEVIRREEVNGFTYIWVRYENGREVKLSIPFSFENGVVEALGSLKDEVDQAITERLARLATTPSTASSAPAKRAAAKTTPSGPIPAAFEKYLIGKGYKLEGDNGNRSTVYYYIDGVETVLTEEGISWETLRTTIHDLIPRYDAGGAKELIGAKQHRTVICSLKQFAEFVGKP